jgi:hypothetical protein
MKWLSVVFLLVGCGSMQTQPLRSHSDSFYIQFDKSLDSIKAVPFVQITKPIKLKTNLPDFTYVKFTSNVYVKVKSAPQYTELSPTINGWSRAYDGYLQTTFGVFDVLIGNTATVIASTNINGKVLADTMHMVVY